MTIMTPLGRHGQTIWTSSGLAKNPVPLLDRDGRGAGSGSTAAHERARGCGQQQHRRPPPPLSARVKARRRMIGLQPCALPVSRPSVPHLATRSRLSNAARHQALRPQVWDGGEVEELPILFHRSSSNHRFPLIGDDHKVLPQCFSDIHETYRSYCLPHLQ